MDTTVTFQHAQTFTLASREKRAMPFQEITRGFSNFGLRASLRRRLGKNNSLTKSRPLILTKTLAVSDGELNVLEPVKRAGTQCSNSNSNLPSVPGGRANGVGRVASWAVSFERLLEDPLGVYYFTEFLKSEVSVENILFWLACENFRQIPAHNTEKLSKEALLIYNGYLSKNATSPINIDDKVRVDEKDVQNPYPEIFQKAQQQIFKLMKFDSYTRFVRSQLYQNCMLANVEGRPLPEPGQGFTPTVIKHSSNPATREQNKSEQKFKEKPKVMSGRTSAESEDVVERRKVPLKGKMSWEKRKEKRGSWGEPSVTGRPGSLHSAEMERLVARSTDSGSEVKPTADKYCCVFLPDGTASLTPARPGLTIRSMLAGLCEKRGLPLSDIIIYMQGKEKQPLFLDQDSSVLKEQQIILELRVTFAVEVAYTGKTMAMRVKSNKTLQEALSSVLQKHHLRPQDVIATMKGSTEQINMNTAVTNLANKILILDKVKGVDQGVSSKMTPALALQARRGAVDVDMHASSYCRPNPRQKNPALRRTYDMEGLVELLNRAQCCSADDQRGLLKKDDLTLPQFLQLPLMENDELEQQAELETAASSDLREPTEKLEELSSNLCSVEQDSTDSSSPLLYFAKPVDKKRTENQRTDPARETEV